MSLTFYFAPMSTAEVTRAVLAELGTAHDRVDLDIQAGDTRKPDFLKVNPNGRVPAIVHDGTAIWESSAITMYLGELFGVDAGLYPAQGPKRGEAMKWIAWSNVALAEAGSRLGMALMAGSPGAVESGSQDYVRPEQRHPDAADTARGDLDKLLKILDRGLEGKSFLLDDYSLADTHLQSLVGWIGMMHVDMQPFHNVTAWLTRCAARPALAKLFSA